jgi:hypothetical protein
VYADHLYPTSLNHAGEVAFVGGPSRGLNAPRTIYAGSPGSVVQVAREGDPAPGTPEGVLYRGLPFGEPVLNDAGQVAFAASLEGNGVTEANDYAIFSGQFSAPSLVARAGSPAPGTPAGVTYASRIFGEYSFGLITELNVAGQMAFLAPLAGPGVTEATDAGLFFYDPVLGTRLVVREGDLFDLGGGERREIAWIDFHNDADWGNTSVAGLSDDGRLAFSLFFTDGSSGVFLATVPEPAGFLLLSTAALGLLGQRRRAIAVELT